MELFKVFGTIALEGQAAVERALRRFEDVGRRASVALTRVGDAAKRIGGDLTAGLTAPIVGLGAAVAALSPRTVAYITDLRNAGAQMGMTARDLQGLHLAFADALSGDQVTNAFANLNRGIQDFVANGTGALQGFFEDTARRYGITARQMAGMTPTEQMETLFRTIQRASNGTRDFNARITQMGPEIAALGRIWEREGPGSLGRRTAAAEDSPARISEELERLSAEWSTRQARLGESFAGLANRLSEAMLPVMLRLADLFESRVLPMLNDGAAKVAELAEWFLSLDAGMQSTIGAATGIAAALGPVLVVIGSVIKVIAPLVSGLVTLASWAVRLVAVFNPVIAVLAAFAAGFYAGQIAMEYFWRGVAVVAVGLIRAWQGVSAYMSDLGTRFAAWGQEAFNGFIAWISRLPDAVYSVISNMADRVAARIRGMVDSVTGAFAGLYDVIVGNSIIPDLARDVVAEVDGMADQSIRETERMARGMAEAMPSEAPDLSPRGGAVAGRNSGYPGEAGGVTINAPGAIFRDDRDMMDRARRAGADPVGVY